MNPIVEIIRHRIRSSRRRLLGERRSSADSLNSGKDLTGRFCENPFRQFDVYEDGKVHSCCMTWLPKPIGNLKHDSLEAVWNSPASQAIRASILDGSFRYCNHRVCPHIQDDRLPTLKEARENPLYREIIDRKLTRLPELPTFVNLCNDASCNLWCPSCRTHRINHTKGRQLAKRQHLQDSVVQILFAVPTDREFTVNITGSGDPFASHVFRDFLFNLDGRDFPNLKIQLQTNGVLLTPKNWRRMERIHSNIDVVLISFDAATPETYAITRRGGHWDTLLENVRALSEFRRQGQLGYLRLDFVVQQANYREMPAFVRLARELGADKVFFSMVLDWGTWPPGVYEIQCIWRRDHPEFDRFMEVMGAPELGDPMVVLGNLTECRQAALEGVGSA